MERKHANDYLTRVCYYSVWSCEYGGSMWVFNAAPRHNICEQHLRGALCFYWRDEKLSMP